MTRFPRALLILAAIIAATVPVEVNRLGQGPQAAVLPAYFKQLSGPPTDFADMAPADPARSATHSKSALLPVVLQDDGAGRWVWQSDISLEAGHLRFAVVSGASRAVAPGAGNPEPWTVAFRRNAGAAVTEDVAAIRTESAQFGLSAASGIPATSYVFEGLAPGTGRLSISSAGPGQGFVLLEGSGTTRLLSHQVAFNQRVGNRIGILAHVYDRDRGLLPLLLDHVEEATLRVVAPDGTVTTSAMYDDGRQGDGQAGDGVYGGDFVADVDGVFNAQVIVRGRDTAGNGFLRTAEHSIPIVEDRVDLRGPSATVDVVSERRLRIRVGVETDQPNRHYRVVAQVWGAASPGAAPSRPVAWVGGMVAIADGSLNIGFDRRWVTRAGAYEPFELRQLRVEDPDAYVTVAAADRLPIVMPTLPVSNQAGNPSAVDEEMLAGPRPATMPAAAELYTSGVGHKLLLVHGYCSSDVWAPVAGQFTNNLRFTDLGQNRSNDQFAQRILNQALAVNSYSIVAHSQGGMAALHLYANYWSGLDNAGPGRLIQSVGTPYLGTPLALPVNAFLAQLAGIGCGANTDLTPTGAANWLAGIPVAKRAAVNYYTTSYTDSPGVDDYCNSITEIILDAPNDGVVEQVRGQLASGVNQGHTIGWCHTSGMRDPSQITDAGRNATMNANAAVGPPEVTTAAASAIGETTATFNGTVNPNGASTTTAFEYGTTTAYGLTIVAQTRSGSTAQSISAPAVLSCGTTYEYRATGTNSAGTRTGQNMSVTTSACQTRVVGLTGNLAFGNVTVDATAARTLTISNTGNASLTVSALTYPSGFSGSWSGAIPPGGTQDVTVTFAPVAATSYGGTVTVNSDKTSGTDTIGASGTGVIAVPGAFSHISPAFGALSQSTSPTLTWGVSAGAASYEYCIDTSDNDVCSTNWISTGAATSVALSGLAAGTKHTWHVRAINGAGTTYAEGAATAFWYFVTGGPPGPFAKISPADGTAGEPPLFTLLLSSASAGATSFEYCIDTTDNDACDATWTPLGFPSLLPATTYYWQMRAINGFGTTYADGSAAAFWSFTTAGAAPGDFGKSTPATGATGQPTSPTLSWGASIAAVSYEYCVDTVNNNACDTAWVSAGNATSASVTGLPASTTHYWHVRAINGTLTTYADSGATMFWAFTTGVPAPAFGQMDTPAQNATGAQGAIGVTGWALDDVGVNSVQIYRNCLAFEPGNCQSVLGNSVVYIGDAAFLAGARPDVAAAFPTYPNNARAGWGYLMLTPMLPHVPNAQAFGGQGPLTLYAIATDTTGNKTLLSRSFVDVVPTPTTFTMANDTIAKPFGAIDTPGQGQTIGGIFNNFGWVITPDLNTVADGTDIFVPTNGSTMTVFIDGLPVSTVAYNQCRGSAGNPVPPGVYCNDDVSNIFGNPTPELTPDALRTSNPTKFRNLDAARAPIGAFTFNTNTLANGLHTIAWSVTDSAGRNEGIGSRFFLVQNGAPVAAASGIDNALLAAPSRVLGAAATLDVHAPGTDGMWSRSGFNLATPWATMRAKDDGTFEVRLPELGRLELWLGADVDAGFLVAEGKLHPLPVGSSLVGAQFGWTPPAGYTGAYTLVFVRGGERITVTVTVGRK